MKLKEGDSENHSCRVIYGKCHHVATDSANRVYCMYCHKELFRTQVIDKMLRRINEN